MNSLINSAMTVESPMLFQSLTFLGKKLLFFFFLLFSFFLFVIGYIMSVTSCELHYNILVLVVFGLTGLFFLTGVMQSSTAMNCLVTILYWKSRHWLSAFILE